jgi:hypothetical protein
MKELTEKEKQEYENIAEQEILERLERERENE